MEIRCCMSWWFLLLLQPDVNRWFSFTDKTSYLVCDLAPTSWPNCVWLCRRCRATCHCTSPSCPCCKPCDGTWPACLTTRCSNPSWPRWPTCGTSCMWCHSAVARCTETWRMRRTLCWVTWPTLAGWPCLLPVCTNRTEPGEACECCDVM